MDRDIKKEEEDWVSQSDGAWYPGKLWSPPQSEDAFTEEEDTDGAEDNDDISTHS